MNISTTISVRRIRRFILTLLIIAGTVSTSLQSQVQSAVNLGSTSNFVILAGSLISNIPASAVTGDIGLSPAAGSGITGFGAMEITGKVYTVDATGPVGSITAAALLTAAKGDLTIAYNDAAARVPVPVGNFLNPGTGNIGGLTLVPGLYKFTSGASITGSDVTLSGSATDVWIFQIAAALNVGTGVKVILAGGAKAGNIFWQVGTSATLGTTSVFKGTILAAQSITLMTGASLEGRALASNAAVTLASNVITKPSAVSTVLPGSMPQKFSLEQNFPNPFNPSTTIQYSLEKASPVSLTVYDLIGGEVATLVSGNQEAGTHTIQFNSNLGTTNLTSGVYFYRLNAGSFVSIRKMILMK
jgi:hypothetical protein